MALTDRLAGLVTAVAIKAPCRIATTANTSLSGLQTIDGVSLALGDRVLVRAQTDATANGLYVADSGAWTRPPDFDGSGDFVQGTIVAVVSGALYNNTVWQLTTASPEIGSALAFAIMGTGALSGVSTFMQTVLPALSAALARATLGAVGLTGDETIAGNKTFSGASDFTGGTIAVPTAPAGDNDTSAASTAFVLNATVVRRAIADAAVAVADTDRTIVFTSLSVARTVTLPAASGIVAGRTIDIVDGSGSCSVTNKISLVPNGTDIIAGSNTTQVAINVPRGRCRLVCNGSNGWDVLQWSVVYAAQASGDIDMNNTANYFTGISVAQGTVGTWEVTAGMTVGDTGGGSFFLAKLWDATTTVAGGAGNSSGANGWVNIAMAGVITAPTADLRASCRDTGATTGKIKFNVTGTSKDTWIVAKRIA